MIGPIIETPRGRIITERNGKAVLSWNTANFTGRGASAWQGRFSMSQKFVDSEILRLSEPYTPLLTSVLIKSGLLGTVVGSGLVQWIAPYSRAQYYAPRAPGSSTGALRGPFWFERMKAVRGRSIVIGAKRIAGTGEK